MQQSASNCFELEWGQITVESFDESKNCITLIFNFNIVDDIRKSNVIQFVFGRIFWGLQNFPPRSDIEVIFDIRGQNADIDNVRLLKKEILARLSAKGITNTVNISFIQ